MIKSRPILLFALIYATLFSIIKLVILIVNIEENINDLIQVIALWFINDFLIGFLISAVWYSIKSKYYLCGYFILVIAPIIFFELLAFHYKLVFGRSPGVEILYYLSEISHLSSSLQFNLSPALFIFEFFSILFILYFVLFKELVSRAKPTRNSAVEFLALFLIVVSLGIQAAPSLVPDKWFWHSRQPLVWLVQSKFIKESYNLDELTLSNDDFDAFLINHGHTDIAPIINNQYPVCRFKSEHDQTTPYKNIILLILEGVGVSDMHRTFDDKVVMPNLLNISRQNTSFNRAHSPGNKSVQALTAIFSGLPAHTDYHYLWKKPMLNLSGFIDKLNAQGFKTAYFHGSDLSFEQQRQYLDQVGFKEIYEIDNDRSNDVYGWGYDDGVMLKKVQQWIEKHNAEKEGQPYFTSLFTIGTHDPYVLPSDWQPVFTPEVRTIKDSSDWSELYLVDDIEPYIAETYHFLDYHLGKFYEWYEENEKQNGTVLVIVGDHVSHPYRSENTTSKDSNDFHIPMIFSGLVKNEEAGSFHLTNRLTSLHDLPASIMHLTGNSSHDCDLGLNIFMPENEWPKDRLTYSVSGDSLEKVTLRADKKVVYDRVKEEFEIDSKKISVHENSVDTESYKNILDNLFKVHYFLLKKDAYFPDYKIDIHAKHVRKVKQPIFVSHRGNINGESGSKNENSRQALDAVLSSKFEWVEVDVQMTADGIPVLMHDAYIFKEGRKIYLDTLSLEQVRNVSGNESILTLEEALKIYSPKINMLVEVKQPRHISMIFHMAREISRIIKNHSNDKKIIVDSFNDVLISSIKNQCECETGLDTPYKVELNESALEHIKKMKMDWVYIHYSVLTPELVRYAHKIGLKVMAYTVNSKDILKEWQVNEMPDGVITDSVSIVQ